MTRKQVSFPVSDKEHEQIKRLAQKRTANHQAVGVERF